MDVRPGGVWRFVMHGPDGRDYKNKIIFHEVVKNERLTYTHLGEGEDPNQFETTVTFDAEGTKTKLTLRSIFPTAAERDRVVKEYGAIEGGKQTLERLAHHLAKIQKATLESPAESESFVITRVFDAPRHIVFKAWTDPEHLKRWWGPAGCQIGHCKMDLRTGGMLLYSFQMPGGPVMWGRFVFREIAVPERLVFVNSFSDENGGMTRPPFDRPWPPEILHTVTFAEEFGKTTLTLLATPINATPEEIATFRDGTASLEQGFAGTMDRLAAHLERIQ
jgi:uncharacterized protein YndB with AHSA1/START domain